MKLGQKAQYAMLLVLYLSRAGRARTVDAAKSMGLSVNFLEQVARKLRQASIIKSVRGPGGGYELQSDPSIGEVLDAVGVSPVMTRSETDRLQRGGGEQRALADVIGNISINLSSVLKGRMVAQLEANSKQEGNQLESVGVKSTVN